MHPSKLCKLDILIIRENMLGDGYNHMYSDHLSIDASLFLS
jgi:hypothetical protein